MLIGAYRDNEVGPAHPLMRKLQAMRQAGAIVHDIVLAPLTRYDLEKLIADSLHCEPERAGPLAGLVEEKTTGNPFFAIQFIFRSVRRGIICFDHIEGHWSWDLNRIHAKGYTDNVVDLMVGKLNRLPIETQKALQQLACLGNSADFAMLHTGLPRFERRKCMDSFGKQSGLVSLSNQKMLTDSSTTVCKKQPTLSSLKRCGPKCICESAC